MIFKSFINRLIDLRQVNLKAYMNNEKKYYMYIGNFIIAEIDNTHVRVYSCNYDKTFTCINDLMSFVEGIR